MAHTSCDDTTTSRFDAGEGLKLDGAQTRTQSEVVGIGCAF
tara:strand:- start:420 stop:542 length:123 start_codon:yes stop_codon:yes gene_type:complete